MYTILLFFVSLFSLVFAEPDFADRASLYTQVMAGRTQQAGDVLVLFPESQQEIEQRVDAAIVEAEQAMEQWRAIPATGRTIENTIHAFDMCSARFDSVRNVLSCASEILVSSDLKESMQAAVKRMRDITPELFQSDAVHQVLKAFAHTHTCEGEDARFLALCLKGFEKYQCDTPEKQEALNALVAESQSLLDPYVKNAQEDTYEVLVTDNQLRDVSDEVKEKLEQRDGQYVLNRDSCRQHRLEGKHFAPEIREQLMRARCGVGAEANRELVNRQLAVRQQIADMLGYQNFVAFRMAQGPLGSLQRYSDITERMHEAYKSTWNDSFQKIITFAEEHGMEECLHDGMIRQESYSVLCKAYDASEKEDPFDKGSSEYFVYEEVLPKVLHLYEEWTGYGAMLEPAGEKRWIISFRQGEDLKGVVILNIYPEGQVPRGCGCTWPLVAGDRSMTRVSHVQAAYRTEYEGRIAASFRNVSTLVHELGHAIANMSDNSRWVFSGPGGVTPVSRAACDPEHIEVDPMILEAVLRDAEMLQFLGAHYKTGEPLNDKQIESLIDTRELESLCCHWSFTNGLVRAQNEKTCDDMNACYWDSEKRYSPQVFHLEGLGRFGNCHWFMADNYGPDLYKYSWSSLLVYGVTTMLKKQGLSARQIGRRIVERSMLRGGTLSQKDLVSNVLDTPFNLDDMVESVIADMHAA